MKSANVQTAIQYQEAEEWINELEKALQAALSALRSYQYGNDSEKLAEEAANYCEAVLAKGRPQ